MTSEVIGLLRKKGLNIGKTFEPAYRLSQMVSHLNTDLKVILMRCKSYIRWRVECVCAGYKAALWGLASALPRRGRATKNSLKGGYCIV